MLLYFLPTVEILYLHFFPLNKTPSYLCRMSIPSQRPGAAEAEASSVQSVSQWNQSGGCHLSTVGLSNG